MELQLVLLDLAQQLMQCIKLTRRQAAKGLNDPAFMLLRHVCKGLASTCSQPDPEGAAVTGNWQALYDEMAEMRAACGEAHVKAILATGELGTLRNVARASLVCMMAGADFIKTSTGKEKVNANLVTSLSMIRMIRWFFEETGIEIGYKPAGGIATAKLALDYLALIKEELGTHWLQPHLFRFGASSPNTSVK